MYEVVLLICLYDEWHVTDSSHQVSACPAKGQPSNTSRIGTHVSIDTTLNSQYGPTASCNSCVVS